MTDSPAGKVDQVGQEAPKTDIPQIPKPRLDEEIGKRRELEAQNAELMAKLRAMESSKGPPTDIESAIQRGIAPLERQLSAARMAARNGFTEDAANVVLDYQAKGLDEAEALAAARAKKPDLFVRKGDTQFRAAQHGALTPQSGAGVPQADDWNYKQLANEARAVGRSRKDITIEDIRRRQAGGGFKQ